MKELKLIRNGVLLLDKPKGITSNRALFFAKKIFNAKKAGHAGTLDPLASGILPILFGEATKFAEFGLNSDKRYIAKVAMGSKTSTGDSEGEIVRTKFFDRNLDFKPILSSFIGKQYQLPPMYSALKYKGKPLYEYARKGKKIPREMRLIHIKSLKFISLKESILTLDVTCSKGTYIRTLAEDIGEKLGSCAHLCDLRRIEVGVLGIENAFSLNKLQQLYVKCPDALNKKLKPVELFINHWPSIVLNQENKKKFLNGQKIQIDFHATKDEKNSLVRVYSLDESFLGSGKIIENDLLQPVRLISQ